MAQKDKAALNTQAQEIKNETADNANTATRVGTMLEDLIDSSNNEIDQGTPLSYVELDITTAYNEFGDFNMPSTFNPALPLYLRAEWTNTTGSRIQQNDVMNFANTNDGSNFADVTMNFISNVDGNSTAAMVFLWTNDWSVGDLITPVVDGIFDYRKVILYQYN